MNHPFWLIFSVLITFFAINTKPNCQASQSSNIESNILQFEEIADLIIERLSIQPGEKIMCVGKPGGDFDPIVRLLAQKIAAKNAEYLGTLSVTDNQPKSWSSNFTRATEGLNLEELQSHFRQCDAGIMLPGAVPTDLPYRAMQNVLDTGSVRTIHFHWAGAYSLGMDVLEISDAISSIYQNALLETDYEALSKKQHEMEAAMRGSLIRVTTPAGTDVSLKIGTRPVTKQDGDASALRAQLARNLIDREIELPAGALRVAPIEESVNGVIVFPPSHWGGTKVKGLTLTFNSGVVTQWSAEKGGEAFETDLKSAGDAARAFREIAIGLSPLLAIPESNPWIPYYGYGAGVVRLSLGNNLELGGKVGGDYVRWNFFTDATVSIDDEVWIRDGILVH